MRAPLSRRRDTWLRRVLVTPDTAGNVWTYVMELTQALKKRGVDVAVATMGKLLTRDQREQVRASGNPQIFENDYSLEWRHDPRREMNPAGEWLLRIENQVQPDIVHLNDYGHAALPWSAPVALTGHSCGLSRYRAARGHDAPADWHPNRERVAEGLRAANVVIAPSRAMLDSLEQHYGPLRTSVVIPHGRNSMPFRHRRKERFILSSGEPWDEASNIGCLARAAGGLDWPVFIAGEFHGPGSSHVTELGNLSLHAMTFWMSRAPVYCLPAKYEPFGFHALDAALSGCALVLGDISSLREVWGTAASYVDPADSTALHRTLAELISDAGRRDLLAGAAYERALQISAHDTASAHMDAYNAARESATSRQALGFDGVCDDAYRAQRVGRLLAGRAQKASY